MDKETLITRLSVTSMKIRLKIKMFLKKHFLMHCFCKVCGRYFDNDWQCTGEQWRIIENDIKYGSICCYDCAVTLFEKHGYSVDPNLKITKIG